MNGKQRGAFSRTRRVALAVSTATALTLVATDPGSAAPNQDAAPFDAGTGSASALGYKANPTNGNLSFGITAGESIAGHQNTGATGQSRAINLGVIGVTLAGEGCDGGDPTLPADEQPQPVIARSNEEDAPAGKSESEGGVIEKFARANPQPFAEAITTIAPSGDPAGLFISGGRTIAHSGVVEGGVREALARTELGSVVLGGGAVEIQGMTWEALHRSGAVEETRGTFSMGKLLIGGQVVPLPGEGLDQLASLKAALEPLGIRITPPSVRVEEGIVFVDPLKVGIIPSPERDSILSPVIGGAQPLRDAIVDALLEADCGNATYVTVADIVLGSVSGAGQLVVELGGVQATTAEIDGFSFPGLPTLPELPPLVGDLGMAPDLGGAGTGSFTPAAGAATPPAAPDSAGSAGAPDAIDPETVADVAGERGGLLALVGGGGLLMLVGMAEADRRKMQRALREIPLEA